ncbi:beta-lactamase domain protein (plasmid) [Thalassoporum mexicanum PCC 7367]|uniref:FprA family A-type flavoprotein n=1 Tax=Thalassoporum mexicanum TaxID=3457544 RepID=UPI0002A000AF|nr:FprA family A-type flavoprotein [Pseudanabaena sp. PCC 7367]AFY72137.1 beta-lactamase domain protein [Pseudanabaena sp. PCC 7367]
MSSTQTVSTRPRDVQVAEIAPNTLILRSRTWDRLKFEVEYSRQQGTTANSYLLRGDRQILIDPPGESFTDIYLAELQQHLDLRTLDYVILSHVNPNRAVTLQVLMQKAPQATIICSRPGENFLKATFLAWTPNIQTVRSTLTLDFGQSHPLVFVTVPTPRWPDGLCTYDPATQILYTDKLFGAHICNEAVFDQDWKALDRDRRYYFDCLHAPQAKQVETALEKLGNLPAKIYAPGHGPVVRYSLSRFVYDYRQWCDQQQSQELSVALLYASAYGNTAVLANAIAEGLVASGVQVNTINCESAEPTEIMQAVEACDGFMIGSPTLGGHAPTQIQTALGIVLSAAAKTKLAGVFGSYGWSGEAIDLLEGKLRDANYRFGFQPIRVKFSPTESVLQECQAAGSQFAQTLKENKKLRSPRLVVARPKHNRTAQAVSRIIGSLCVLTTRDDESHRGILTSSVSQASFNPPGLVVAIADDQNADLIDDPGDKFILNILKEGRNVRRYFSRHSTLGDNPFASLPTNIGENGCLVLEQALSYLECTVQQAMKCGDRYLVYATVDRGQMLENEGVTAIEQHKSGT